ncbi:N-acetylglucosaminyltransferase [Fusarium torreyae]|uniref:N-acetylglucosaminyltransferase n=1 Tax=Fusarium torreyae TaxID=1237075 RepID=A0A9W8SF64_9HYPO|nr:N-acetylglucosaminyltransferase [Fusarium torreyae]
MSVASKAPSFVMARLIKLVPFVIFIASIFYFVYSFSTREYPEVPVPEGWKKHDVTTTKSADAVTATLETTIVASPQATPDSGSDVADDGWIFDISDEDEEPVDTMMEMDDDEMEDDMMEDDMMDDDGDLEEELLKEEYGENEDSETHHESNSSDSSTVDDIDDVDWSRFAYIQYVTNEDYLCNSVMIFEALHRLGSKADRLMMYPKEMLSPDAERSSSHGGKLLIRARDEYNVTLQPIEIQHRDGQDDTWADSFTKLLAFNQTQYDRVLSLDSDSMILQPMDELFQLPPSPVAMPRAYWLYAENPPKKILSSQIMVIQPDKVEFERIEHKMNNIGPNDYDMEIVNSLYLDSALIIPHRKYDILTAEFRNKDHKAYLGSDREEWDAAAVLSEAKFVHFSDWPVPKPWISAPELRQQNQPGCTGVNETTSCTERDIWNGLYTDFANNRERVCESVGKSSHQKWIHWKRMERFDERK